MKCIFLSTIIALVVAISIEAARTEDSSGFSSRQSVRRSRPAELAKEKDKKTLGEAVKASDIATREKSRTSIGNIRKKGNTSVRKERNHKNIVSSSIEATHVFRNDTNGSNATLVIDDIAIATAQQENSSGLPSIPRANRPRTDLMNEKSQETLDVVKISINPFKKETNKADTTTPKHANIFENGNRKDKNTLVHVEVETTQTVIGGENSIALTSQNKNAKSGKQGKSLKAVSPYSGKKGKPTRLPIKKPTCPPIKKPTRSPTPRPDDDDTLTLSPISIDQATDSPIVSPIESVPTPSPSPGADESLLDCDAGTDWDGWAATFGTGLGCAFFDGVADVADTFFPLYDEEIGKPHCELFYANLGGLDDNVDITANEACIICGACDVCSDFENYTDAAGLNCEGYRDDALFDESYPDKPLESTWCSAYGAQPADEGPYTGVTPTEACCICGGGTRESRRKSRKKG